MSPFKRGVVLGFALGLGTALWIQLAVLWAVLT